MANYLELLTTLSNARVPAEPIVVDIEALRHAHTEEIMNRDPVEGVTDVSDELDHLTEFSLLSLYARRKS